MSRKLVKNALTNFLCEAKPPNQSKIITECSISFHVQGKPDETQSFSTPNLARGKFSEGIQGASTTTEQEKIKFGEAPQLVTKAY